MKSILLASASIVAFTIAGAAQAEVSFGGEINFGFNDDDDDVADDQDGFYWDGNLAVTLSQMLDSGLTIEGTFDFDFVSVDSGVSGDADDPDTDGLGVDLASGGFLLGIYSDTAGLWIGDTTFAAQDYYAGVADMDSDGFSEADGETVMKGTGAFGAIEFGLSYVIADANGNLVGDDATIDGSVDQMSLGGTYTGSTFSVGVAYQEESEATDNTYMVLNADGDADSNGDFTYDEIFAVFGGVTFGAADISFAYASNETADTSSTGVGISYPFGPVVLGAGYASNPDGEDAFELTAGYENGPITVSAAYEDGVDSDDTTKEYEYSIDATYAVGGAITVLGGLNGAEGNVNADGDDAVDYYVAMQYALSDAASVSAIYAVDDDDSEEDEIGAPEYQEGTTVEINLTF